MNHDISETLVALGAAFLVCGLVARAGSRIGLPTIPLFMAAGIIFGPHTGGFVLVADPHDLELVARLGLIFLLFYLGLEFTLDDLTSGGRKLLGAASAYLALNVGGGLVLGFSMGWGTREALVMAGIVGISSTAIITKLLVENRRLGNPETKTILGIAVLEDVFLAFYLALLQPVLSNASGPREAVVGIVSAFAFLMALFLIARYGARYVGKFLEAADEEIVVVFFVGLAIITAGAAELVGVSDAIGAFMVGLILGATARASRLRDLTHPLRDGFGAIFFFHVGLTIVPAAVLALAPQILLAAAMTTVLATVAGVIAARMHDFTRLQAANIGFTVLTRGEFSLILATLAVSAGLDPRIGAFTAGYVLLLAVVGPIAASWSATFARVIPARLFRNAPEPDTKVPALDLDVGVGSLHKLGADLLQVRVNPGSSLHGVHVGELRLPAGSTLGLLQRDGATSALKATTQLQTHDVLVLFTTPEIRHSAERRIRAVHRSGRLATWRGDTGR